MADPKQTPPAKTNPKSQKKSDVGAQINRLSRRHQIRLNPVPWIIALCLALVLYFFMAHGKLLEWKTNKENIQKFSTEITDFESSIENLRAEVDDLQEKFSSEKKKQNVKEKGLFPEEINNKRIVKILEIFILKLVNIENKEDIQLNSLSIGQSSSQSSEIPGAMKRQITFSVEIDQEELETLIWYLQNNEIPPRMVQAKEDRKFENDLNDYITLDENRLPLMLIENINRSGNIQQEGQDTGFFNVTISGNFFHQPPTEDEPN